MHVAARVLSKPYGGKADALNAGVAVASGEIIVCVDADSVLHPEAIERVIESFGDPRIGAVGGIVKVANQKSMLGKQQAMEYLSGLALQRAAFAQVDSIQVLSGAISAFRREALAAVGGYSDETIVEDFDITVAVQKAGYRAVLNPAAIAYTEGPLTVRDLVKQRHRWTFGGFQVLSKYRRTLFTGRMGLLSRVGLPYFLIFPWVDVAVSALFLVTVGIAAATGSLGNFLLFFTVMSVVNFLVNLHVLRIAEERWTLALWGLAQPFFYAHILTFTTLRSGLLYIRKGEARWDKLARGGHNEIPLGARMTAEDAALAA